MDFNVFVNCRFLTQKISGVQRYAIEISKQLKKLHPDIVFLSPRGIIHSDVADELNVHVIGKSNGHLWEQLELPFYLKQFENPLLINLANTAPVFTANIVTIHDLAVWDFPQSYNWKFRSLYKFLIPVIARRAKAVFTVSQFSKTRIADGLKITSEKIFVAGNAVSEKFLPAGSEKKKIILGVSSLDPKKNFAGLIKAFLAADLKDFELVVVGSRNALFNDAENNIDLSEYTNIRFTGYISDEELIKLYQSAMVFVYPSFYEGFGIPPLEAMSCGCPVIVSDIPPLKEVCGDSALYVKASDFKELEALISKVVKDSDLVKSLGERGMIQARKFSWNNSAKRFIELITKIKGND